MRFNRSVIRMVLLLCFLVVFNACSNEVTTDQKNEESPVDNLQTATSPVKNNSNDPVEIIFYSNNGDPEESFDYRYGDLIREKFPEYSIKYIQRTTGTSLEELITTGTRFDVFFQSIGNFEANAFPYGIEYDMTELIQKHQVDLNRFEKTVIDAIIQASGGKLYGLPVQTNNFILYYNKDIFDRFGESYPENGLTWDEMVEISLRLSRMDGDVQYLGYNFSPTHTLRLNPMSIPHVNLENDTPTINNDQRWREFFETFFVKPTEEAGYTELIRTTGLPVYHRSFVEDQNVAMMYYLSSLIYVWEEQLKAVNWDIAAAPTINGLGSQSYPSYFGITQMADNKDAAMEVLKYMVSDEVQSQISRKGIMPVLDNDQVISEFGLESPYSDRNMSAVFYNDFAPIAPKAPYDGQMVTIYYNHFISALRGEVDINTALRQAEEEALIAIQEFKKQND